MANAGVVRRDVEPGGVVRLAERRGQGTNGPLDAAVTSVVRAGPRNVRIEVVRQPAARPAEPSPTVWAPAGHLPAFEKPCPRRV